MQIVCSPEFCQRWLWNAVDNRKTRTGFRRQTHVVPVLRLHLEEYAGKDRLFVSRDGSPLRGNTLYQAYVRARKHVGLDDLAFHDLRHTGQTLAAQTGATMADLMKRLGHSSIAAARRYLHAVDGRDREIARALSNLAAHGDAARLPERGGRTPSHVARRLHATGADGP